jgi:hypothetical protein
MRAARRVLTTIATAAALAAVTMTPASAAGPVTFTVSGSGLSADAVFTDAPLDAPPVTGRVYTDVFVYAADEAVTADGTTYTDDFAFVDVFSYKFDRRGNQVLVSSTSGSAGGDQVTFTADGKRLATASLTASVALRSCTSRGCTDADTTNVSVTWTGNGPTTTFKNSFRTNDPGQFHSTGRFSGSSRAASATGTVPVLGDATAVFAGISSGAWTERTICHGC